MPPSRPGFVSVHVHDDDVPTHVITMKTVQWNLLHSFDRTRVVKGPHEVRAAKCLEKFGLVAISHSRVLQGGYPDIRITELGMIVREAPLSQAAAAATWQRLEAKATEKMAKPAAPPATRRAVPRVWRCVMFDRTITRIRMRLDASSKGMLINGQERLMAYGYLAALSAAAMRIDANRNIYEDLAHRSDQTRDERFDGSAKALDAAIVTLNALAVELFEAMESGKTFSEATAAILAKGAS